MNHKVFYSISKEVKELYADFLKSIKYEKGIDRAVYEILINVGVEGFDAINAKEKLLGDGRLVKFNVDKVDKTIIPEGKEFVYNGEKSVVVCGDGTYIELMNACKLENYLRKKDGKPTISFEEFIDNCVKFNVRNYVNQAKRAKLETEANQITSEKPSKKITK